MLNGLNHCMAPQLGSCFMVLLTVSCMLSGTLTSTKCCVVANLIGAHYFRQAFAVGQTIRAAAFAQLISGGAEGTLGPR